MKGFSKVFAIVLVAAFFAVAGCSNASGGGNSNAAGAEASNNGNSDPARYSVTVGEGIENGTVSVDSARASSGETIILTITPNDGYELDALTVITSNNTNVNIVTVSSTKKTFSMPAENVTVSATFKTLPANIYSISVSDGIMNGTVTSDKQSATAGETVTLTVNSNDGYELELLNVVAADNTNVDFVSVNDIKKTFVMPNKNIVVNATFKALPPNVYSISVSDGITNGTVTSDKQSAIAGETITLTVNSTEEYELELLNIVAADNTNVDYVTVNETKKTFVMPDKDIVVTANFKAVSIGAYKVLPAGTDGTAGTTGTYVTFGAWPQTIKAEGVTVDESISKNVGMFTYCKGSDGAWYVKQAEYGCGSNSRVWKYSDGTIVGCDGTTEKWFKVEPIKWRLLTNGYNGKKLLFAEKSLINCAYYDCEGNGYYAKDYTKRLVNYNVIYSNNYEHSRVRAYLNGLSYQSKFGENSEQKLNSEFLGKGFLQTAFTEKETQIITDTNVDNSARSTYPSDNVTIADFTIDENNKYACSNTVDKIFCLSVQEITNDEYGLLEYYIRPKQGSHKGCERYCTDFDMANGAVLCYTDVTALYFTRTPAAGSTWKVSSVSYEIHQASECNDRLGIVPALCVDIE